MTTKKQFVNIFPLLISLFVLFTSCDDAEQARDIDNRVIPSENVSYKEHLQPVFFLKCSTSGCHDDQTKAGSYSMTTWSNTVQPGVVDPFSPETSRLMWSIEGLGVSMMPPVYSTIRPMTNNQIEGVRTWIKEGAQNN